MSTLNRAQMRRDQAKRDRTSRPERDVAVVWVCDEQSADPLFTQSLVHLALYDGQHHKRLRQSNNVLSGPRIAHARNQVVHAALATPEVQWLLLLDSDMTFDADTLDRMLATAEARDLAILGGLCFAGDVDHLRPTTYTVERDASTGRLVCSLELSYPYERAFRVHATGAAALLVRRDVFERVHNAWRGRVVHTMFAETTVPPDLDNGYDGDEFGEDVTFLLRAGELGYEVWLDSRIRFGHRKMCELNEPRYLAQLERQGLLDARVHPGARVA